MRDGALKEIKIDGRTIAYLDAGRGPTVILAHCSSASHKEWLGLIETLSDRCRVLAPDLIGYGKSDGWPNDLPFDPYADVNVLIGLATVANGQVHLAGHSYGAATALEAGRLLGSRAKSLTLVEPVAFYLLEPAGRIIEWAEISAVATRVRDAVRQRLHRKAAATYMSYWIGRLRWWLMPRKHRRRIVATVGKVADEFGVISQTGSGLDEYARIDTPTRLIVGGRTRQPARAVVDVLLETLPNAHHRQVPGAGHMSPFTHPNDVHALIAEHIDSCP